MNPDITVSCCSQLSETELTNAGYPQTVILSLSHGFMSHGFMGKKVADGPFFAAGLFFNLFFPDM